MSINTIKLSSVEGDIYINPQQTKVYKGVLLFGYGYLDWGTTINQSIVNLIDKIDALQDSGLSEIEFDLTEYEEEQKRLRAEEFDIWKTGFTKQVKNLTNLFNKELKEELDNLIESQNTINVETTRLINDNYNELRIDLNDLTNTLDDKILDLVNNQLLSIFQKINDLENLVDSTKTSLENATVSLNETKLKTEQALEAFKTEFLNVFEKFKNDTIKALSDNKDYLIAYINEALAGVSSINRSLDQRIMDLELLSGTLNSTNISNLIISKVNEISSGIILNNIDAFANRIQKLENIIIDLDSLLDIKIGEEISELAETLNGTISVLNNTVNDLAPKVNKNIQDLIPLNKISKEVDKEFNHPEEFVHTVIDNTDQTILTSTILNGLVKNYKDIDKNFIVNLLDQLKRNTENSIVLQNDVLLNLIDGLKYTAWDELSLIKRQTSRTKLINEHYSILKDHLDDYISDQFKFTLILKDPVKKLIYFGFKLPKNSHMALWKTMGIKVRNTATNETINLMYEISDSSFVHKQVDFYSNIAISSLGLGDSIDKFKPFLYYANINCSEVTKLKFDQMPEDSNLEFKFYTNSSYTTEIYNRVISLNEIREDNIVSEDFKTNYYDILFNDLYSIAKPTISLQNLTHSSTTQSIHIGPNQIITLPNNQKEWLVRICLPGTNSEIVKIEFNDGVSNYTKNFTNHAKFPLSETEYTTRNLGSTNNYYKDINSTGHIRFPINNASTKITGTLTYKINGTTFSKDIDSAGTGTGTGTALNLGPFNILYDSTNDDLDITYNGDVKFSYNKLGEFTAAGNIFAYSDKTLKKDIEPLNRKLDLDKINSYIFKYLDSNKPTIGFLAQEIQEQLPELVEEDKNQKLKLNYDGMISVLFNLLKESKLKEQQLESRIKSIEEMLGID